VPVTSTGSKGVPDNGNPSDADADALSTDVPPKHTYLQLKFRSRGPTKVYGWDAVAGADNVAFAPSADGPVLKPVLRELAFT